MYFAVKLAFDDDIDGRPIYEPTFDIITEEERRELLVSAIREGESIKVSGVEGIYRIIKTPAKFRYKFEEESGHVTYLLFERVLFFPRLRKKLIGMINSAREDVQEALKNATFLLSQDFNGDGKKG